MMDFLTNQGPTVAYILLFLGACVEGESIVLTASFLAYTGFLSLPAVMTIAFTATLVADQTLFYLGRFYGPTVLARYPSLKDKSQRVFNLLHRYNILFILGFRFIYGIRTVSPFVIGTGGITIKRFTILNLIAAIIWTVVSCLGGYSLGYFFYDSIHEIFHNIVHYQKMIVIWVVSVVGAAIGLIYAWRRWKKRP